MKKTITGTKIKVKTITMVAVAIAVLGVGGIMAAVGIRNNYNTLTPPAALTASCDANGKITIKWSRAKNNSKYYDIRIEDVSTRRSAFAKERISETKYEWQGQSGKTYDVWVDSNSGTRKASAWVRNVKCKK